MGRSLKKIDWKLVDELLEAGCLGTEIAANFDMHPNTFYHHVEERFKMSFSDYSQEKNSKGNSILRAVQYQTAIKDKDRGMLIWLGKQRLGQKEPEKTTETQGTIINLHYPDKHEVVNAGKTTPNSDCNKAKQAKTSKGNSKRTPKKA